MPELQHIHILKGTLQVEEKLKQDERTQGMVQVKAVYSYL
jgi:hypothetical protein